MVFRPSTDPERTYIDHAEGNLLNDTFANLHWVTPAFNTWNRDQKEQDGYFGVYRNGRNKKSISVIFREVGQGSYDNAETAARVYDLVVRLAYKDQVDKTPHLLNNLPDQDKHVVKVESRADGVDIYPVDHYHVLIYDGNVESKHDTLGEAERAAKTFISSREYEELKNWVIRQNERKIPVYQNAITRNADNVAFLPMKLAKNTSVEVLMDDSTWLDLVSASVTLFRGFGNRAMLKLDGKTEFLSRFLRPAGNDIVDHVNRNVLDHRLANLEAGGWIVLTKAKGENRMPSKTFAAGDLDKAIELYDLAALFQHGPSALIDNPENLKEYLEALEKKKTRKEIEDFLAGRAKSSMYEGVSDNITDGRAEVLAAIGADLRKLKTKGPEWRLNFEFMRPWYLHYLPQLNLDNVGVIMDKAYECMGGADFVRDSKTAVATSPRGSPSAAASSSGKRKRDQ
ncbi:hypothetical protein [Sporisorium scitamineum]|uniref:Uncharacterized protein n=1 Tax=Sporisorium scitamineum TaxID=49012 RepID=A0A0F7S867_9BASI|nr:hypothetical protein [Sporisorium scitamineum]